MWNKCKLKNLKFKKKIKQSSDSFRKEISECSQHINRVETFSSTSPFVGPELRISFLDKRWRPTGTIDMCVTRSRENDIFLAFSL